MGSYVVYDKNTGDILRTGATPDEMIPFQAVTEREAVIKGHADDMCDWIDPKTKKIIKNHKNTREAIEEERRKKEQEERYFRAEEELIRKTADEIVRKIAVRKLKKDGVL